VLTNDRGLIIGSSDDTLSAPSTVEAASVANTVPTTAYIYLYGSATAVATLDVGSAASFAPGPHHIGFPQGKVSLSGDALVEFASGQIKVIQNGSLSLNGSHAFVADASDTSSNSALAGLENVDRKSELDLEGGASVTTAGALANSGTISVDATGGDGGSSLTILGGKLKNRGILEIGNSTLSAASTVEAHGLANMSGPNYGTIDLAGSATARATLDVSSMAGFGARGMLYGQVRASGDALVEFESGQITTLGNGSILNLNGAHAFVADASCTSSNSALAGLKAIDETAFLDLEAGATATTSGDLTNSGSIALDENTAAGGSALNIKGTLTNSRAGIRIGNSELSGSSTLTAAKVVNDGAIYLTGSGASQATLICGGPFVNDGSVNLVSDTDTIGGAVRGKGDFSLRNSTLEFVNGVSDEQTATFSGGVNHLYLDSPSAFNATIDDFSRAGDSGIAKTFAEAQTMLTYTQTGADSCSWTLTQGAQTAVLSFAGAPYAQSDFAISAAANGAVLIKFA
jgi:hypothetical protein